MSNNQEAAICKTFFPQAQSTTPALKQQFKKRLLFVTHKSSEVLNRTGVRLDIIYECLSMHNWKNVVYMSDHIHTVMQKTDHM